MDKRILAVSSHVVHGYVGNRASTLPLQLLGWDVDVLNTVSFSNHTGYTRVRGTKITAAEIRALFEGLKENNLTDYDVVLSGYVPGAEAVAEVGRVVEELRRGRDVVWVLDPVLGDEGRLYVAPEVVPVYESLIPRATVITPNQFEAELLCGFKLKTKQDVRAALAKLYERFGVRDIVISSVLLPDEADAAHSFICAGQSVRDGGRSQFFVPLRFIDAYFTGTGDLFACLVADRYSRYRAEPDALARTVEDVSAMVQGVLRTTADAVDRYNEREEALGSRPAKGTVERRIRDMKHGELRIIQAQEVILHPVVAERVQYWTE